MRPKQLNIMAFFKTTRDQLKGNALVSHIEFANQFFKPTDMIRCEHHIRAAQKALSAFRVAKAEYIFSNDGWQYLSTLTGSLQTSLRIGGFDQLASDVGHIADYVRRVLAQRGIAAESLFPNTPTKKFAAFGCLVVRSEELLDSIASFERQNDVDRVRRPFSTNPIMEVCQGTPIEVRQETSGRVLVKIEGFEGEFWTLSSYLQDTDDCTESSVLLKKPEVPSFREPVAEGASFEKAIVLEGAILGIAAVVEHEFLRQHYPGYKIEKQSLKEHGGRSFDVIGFRTRDGESKTLYFALTDPSRF